MLEILLDHVGTRGVWALAWGLDTPPAHTRLGSVL